MFLRRFIHLLILGALTFMFATACSGNSNTNAPSLNQPIENCRKVQHEMGESCIPLQPQRIVTLWSSIYANALALGIQPIATAYYSNEPFPAYLQDKVDGVELLGSINEPNLEKIVQLKSDLILAHPYIPGAYYKQISSIAPTMIIGTSNLAHRWNQDLEDLARLLRKEKVYEQLMQKYWQRIEELKAALKNYSYSMEISVASANVASSIWTYGEKSPVGTILKDAGLKRPSTQQGNSYYAAEFLSEERLGDIDGDVLFFVCWHNENSMEVLKQLQQNPLWQKLKAVQQNRVYFVDALHWHDGDFLAINAILDDLFKYLVNIMPNPTSSND